MSEQPYECQGVLSDYATRLISYIFETPPGEPNKIVLHGYTRRSLRDGCALWRKFHAEANEGDYATLEARAMAFLRNQGELVMR